MLIIPTPSEPISARRSLHIARGALTPARGPESAGRIIMRMIHVRIAVQLVAMDFCDIDVWEMTVLRRMGLRI